MAEPIHVFELLEQASPNTIQGKAAVVGNDWFLRKLALEKVLLATGVPMEAVHQREGDSASWRDVHDDLATRSLFDEGGHRCSLIRSADSFVTKNRANLEKWMENPAPETTLILELEALAANTRLYKFIAAGGTLVRCSVPFKKGSKDVPDEVAVQKWLIRWAASHHRFVLDPKQAHLIVERVGSIFGLLDNELAKLALFADEQGRVSDPIVQELVGGWRTKTAWEIADSIADGKAAYALEQLDHLLASGQSPIGLSAQWSWYFRRFGMAAHLIEQAERHGKKPVLATALEQAGFHRYALANAERQLKRIGRDRARRMLAILFELDLKLKGSHSSDSRARMALEEWILQLA